MSTSDRSIVEILQDVVRNLQEIVRSEVRLAKTELREELSKAKAASLLMAGGAVCSVFAALFLFYTFFYALAILMPNWAAALIISVLLAVTAVVILNAGLKQFKRVQPVPDKTVESMKENVEWAKQQTK